MPFQLREPDLRVAVEANTVEVIELDLGASPGPGKYAVFSQEWTIHRRRDPVA
jgi:hypothetical protein